ncbi:AI-2E family transporter [Bacillus piscicola]|uniref:AI-2E family transporter n=1 Tax=Bacillus piscicola TaxID=1632684 RepID=UPI001F0963A3|nr:AI-2E family transporter [Bacillus piscicola]
MERQKEWVWLQRSILLVVFLFIIFLLSLLKPVWLFLLRAVGKAVLPFLIAAFIAYLLHPLITFLQNRKIPRSLAILFVYVVFFGGSGFLIWYYSPYLLVETQRFISQMPHYVHEAYVLFSNLHYQLDYMPPAIHDSIEAAMEQAEEKLTLTLNQLISKWRNLLDMLVLLLLLPFIVFYLLKDVKAIERLVKRIIPKKWQDEGELLGSAVDEALGDYIRGQFMVAGAVGLLSMLGLWLFDIPNAVFLGIFIGVTDIIPYFGPVLGAAPALMVAASMSTNKLLFVLIILLVIQQIEGNFLSPYVVGRNVNLHPLVIVFALILGFETAGFIGLLLAVPLFVVASNVFQAFKKRQLTLKKNL